MLVSTDFHMPLFHKVYAGNVNDGTDLPDDHRGTPRPLPGTGRWLRTHHPDLRQGQQCATPLPLWTTPRFHFVGSLVPAHTMPTCSTSPAAPVTSPDQRTTAGVHAYRTEGWSSARNARSWSHYNENLWKGQLQGLTAALERPASKLRALQTKFRRRREGRVRGGKAPTAASILKQAQEALVRPTPQDRAASSRWRGRPRPDAVVRDQPAALARLPDKHLGKTILFTDNDDWTNEDIVLAYRSQYHLEAPFGK